LNSISKAIDALSTTAMEGTKSIRECADPQCPTCHGKGTHTYIGHVETGESRHFRATRWRSKITKVCSCVDRSRLSIEGHHLASYFYPHHSIC